MIEYLTAVETVEKNPILKYENRIEVIDSNIIRFKSKEEQQKVPPKEQEAQEMKIQGITIFKNKKCSTWYTRYRKDGKQHYLSGRTQKEVAEKLKEKLNIIKKEKLPYTTFEKWYNQWLALFKIGKVKDSTIRVYNSLYSHLNKTFIEKNIKTITAIEIQELINNTPGERTPQKLFEWLKDIFTTAKKFNIINNNPMEILTKPEHQRKNGIALSKHDQEIFVKACKDDKCGDMFLIGLYLGLRRGELLGLTGDDIQNDFLNVNKSLNYKSEFDTTKNKNSIRLVPIFKNAQKILQKYINYGSNRIFNFSHETADTHFKSILKDKKLSTEYTIHSLRHTFITNCKNANIPEHIIQQWVGHQIGSKVTSTVYTHAQIDANIKYINIINDIIE